MNKRTRLVILIAVLAICFAFLWPSISWYGRTPKEVQQLALGSTENIKNYAESKAAEDVKTIKQLAKSNPEYVLDGDFAWLNKAALKQYKAYGEKAPSELTVLDVVKIYKTELAFMEVIQSKYRDEILKAKHYYDNSVKLGLDLSGGMNVIVRADLDAALAAQGDSVAIEDASEFKKEAISTELLNSLSAL